MCSRMCGRHVLKCLDLGHIGGGDASRCTVLEYSSAFRTPGMLANYCTVQYSMKRKNEIQ